MREPRSGRVRLDPTAFVAPGAIVTGEVSIGPRSSVWYNTVVRGDVEAIEIGEGTNLQDNSTVHVDEGCPVEIGARVTVGHRTIVHGCVIEDDCLIGMGSVLLSGCRIGAGSYVGAASLVLEGTEIPPGSVALGSPARVTGEVGERHREGIRHGTETYAELAAACLRRGLARHVDRNDEIVRPFQPMTREEWERSIHWLMERTKSVEEDARSSRDPREILARCVRLGALDAARHELLRSLLRGETPRIGEAAAEEPGDAGASALTAWKTARASLVSALRALGESAWSRLVRHPTRGPFTVADLVREWVEEDREPAGSPAGRDPR